LEGQLQTLGLGPQPAALEQRGHVVGGRDLAPAPRRGERDIAVAGRDVEHLVAAPEVERLAELFAHDLQRRADHGIVARRPGALLARLDGGEVGGGRGGDGVHGWLLKQAGWWPPASLRRADALSGLRQRWPDGDRESSGS